jgi:geranylgeranyl diphosphate synthase, type II
MGCDLFVEFVRLNEERLKRALNDAMPRSLVAGTEKFNEALNYAIFPGGKRLRSYLTLIAARLGGSSEDQALTFACAIEFIHTCSLVLDDLPSMDDADLRRGRPALHLAFGEGTAILVAMALLNQAYALFARAAAADRLHRLLAETFRCIGSDGMIAGQTTELALSGARRTGAVPASRDFKTTALMRLALVAGAIAAGRPEGDIDALAAFGEMLGKVYQIHDDLADMLGDRQSTGKSVGQDARHVRPSQARSTLLRDASPDELAKRAAGMLASGKARLDRFAGRPETALLQSAADFILAQFDSVARTPPRP